MFTQHMASLTTCHSSFMFFHSSFFSFLNTLKVLHHHYFAIFWRFFHNLIHDLSCLSLVFSDCDVELLILWKNTKRASLSIASSSLRATSSDILFLTLNFWDSIIKIMLSYPPGPHSATALGSLLQAASANSWLPWCGGKSSHHTSWEISSQRNRRGLAASHQYISSIHRICTCT